MILLLIKPDNLILSGFAKVSISHKTIYRRNEGDFLII